MVLLAFLGGRFISKLFLSLSTRLLVLLKAALDPLLGSSSGSPSEHWSACQLHDGQLLVLSVRKEEILDSDRTITVDFRHLKM